MKLFLDLETYSDVPITHGTHAYAERAEVLLVAIAWDDGPVDVWDVQDMPLWRTQLQVAIDHAEEVVIHNSAFDRTVLKHQGVNIPLEKTHDTMVRALMHSLPGSLGQLCDVMRVPTDKAKDKDGKRLIQLFCKPLGKNRKLDRATRETHPVDWAKFCAYAGNDIEAMRVLYAKLPRWNWTPMELGLWVLDQIINERGVAVDLELATAAQRAAKDASQRLADEAAALTGGVVTSATQRGKTLDHLRDLGVEADDLRGGTVEKLLQRDDLADDARALLENRAQASATSPAKYRALSNAASRDARLRGTLQFCGAMRTGRWGGRVFQPQNLPRPNMDADDIEAGIAAMKAGVEDLLFPNVMELCSNAVRGTLVAAPGMKLVIADLSNIEGRMLAFLADEEWKLRAFSEFDKGIGHDLYKLAYAKAFNLSPESVTKDQRQLGKVMELACFGPDTQVLTDAGPVAIKDITHEHRLWDGREWVKHAGLIDRGNRKVMCLDGVEVTPEHRVLCAGTWLPAKTVASSQNCLDLALATGSESLRSLASTLAPEAEFCASECGVPAALRPTAFTSPTSDEGRPPAATPARSEPPVSGEKTGTSTLTSARTPRIGDGCVTASRLATIAATTRTTPHIRTTEGVAFECMSLGEKTAPHFSRISCPSTGGTVPNLRSTASTSIGDTNPETCGSSPSGRTGTTSEKCETSSNGSTSWKRVYDIALAGPRNRFTILTDSGALVVHNCGYQGSVGAFASMAANYGVNLPEDVILQLVKAWRTAHPAIRNLWYGAEDAARWAVVNPGKVYRAGLLSFRKDGAWLRVRLPSGRYLSYPAARVGAGTQCPTCKGKTTVPSGTCTGEKGSEEEVFCPECNGAGIIGKDDAKLTYEGIDQYTRKWSVLKTYGGKLIENATQAASRDILAHGMRNAEAAGYRIVLHVHDELICEVPDTDEYSVEELAKIMATGPQWAFGLPLAAAGFETYRYRKD